MELGRVCVLIATYCRARLFIVAWLDDKEVPKGSLNLPTGQQSPHSRQHSLENNERVLAGISEATHRDAGMHPAQLPVLAHSMIRALCTLCLTFRSVGQANGRNFELRRSAVLLRRANRWHARYVMSHSRYDGIAMRSKVGLCGLELAVGRLVFQLYGGEVSGVADSFR